MKKIILLLLIWSCCTHATNQKPTVNWNQLRKRINQQLDRIYNAVNFLSSLWAPVPKAASLSRKYPIPTIVAIGCWAYLYKKEKKASHVYLAAIYYALYHRAEENKRYGLSARKMLRERETFAIPSTSTAEQS